MDALINQLQVLVPRVTFREGEAFYWSPKDMTIWYKTGRQVINKWALLHEAAHALLQHKNYTSDMDLLLLEVAAWHKAKELGQKMGVQIDEDHIQDCLDTYRDWLHQRSTCPRCGVVSLQISSHEYLCHNCQASWQVSASRFCRPYRRLTHADSRSEYRNPKQASITKQIPNFK